MSSCLRFCREIQLFVLSPEQTQENTRSISTFMLSFIQKKDYTHTHTQTESRKRHRGHRGHTDSFITIHFLPSYLLTWTFRWCISNERPWRRSPRSALHSYSLVLPLWKSYTSRHRSSVVCTVNWPPSQLYNESQKFSVRLTGPIVDKMAEDKIVLWGGGMVAVENSVGWRDQRQHSIVGTI